MIGLLFALALQSELPHYSYRMYSTSKFYEYVEVVSISRNGNVAANNWYGDRFFGDDIANRPTPLFIVGGKLVRPKAVPDYAYATSINDKGQGLISGDHDSRLFLCEKGRLSEIHIAVQKGERFTSNRIDDYGTIFGVTYPAGGIQRILRCIRIAKGVQTNCTPEEVGDQEDHREEGTLKVDGLPDLQHWNFRSSGEALVGYGIHEEPYDGPPNGYKYSQYGLFKWGGKVVPLKSLMADLTNIEIEDGGYVNANGVIAATGTYKQRPAIFVLTP